MKITNKLLLASLATVITTTSLCAQTLTPSDFGELSNYNAYAATFFEVKDATFAGAVGLGDGAEGVLDNGVLNGDVYRHTGATFDGSGGTLNGSVFSSGAINTELNSAGNRFTPLQTKIENFSNNTGGNLGNKSNGDIVFSSVGNTSTTDFITVIDYDKVKLDGGETIKLTGRAGFKDKFVFRADEFDFKVTVMDLTNVEAGDIIWYGRDKAYGNHSKPGGKGGKTKKGDPPPPVDTNFSFAGILFSPEGEGKVGGGGLFTGAVYADEIKIGSGAVFKGVPPVPEPTSALLLGLGAIGAIMRRKR